MNRPSLMDVLSNALKSVVRPIYALPFDKSHTVCRYEGFHFRSSRSLCLHADHLQTSSVSSGELLVYRSSLILQTVIGRFESELFVVEMYALDL